MNQREKVDYLHNKTNYGMLDCSKALKITNDDVKEAYKLLTNHKSGLELTYKVLKLEEEIKELKQELEYYKNGYKLSKLEDIEEQLGCPLEVVFKAIEDGIVIKGVVNQYSDKTLWLDNKPLEALVGEKLDFEEPRLIKYNEWCFSCNSGSYRGCVSLKDYGKTWWMKEEE